MKHLMNHLLTGTGLGTMVLLSYLTVASSATQAADSSSEKRVLRVICFGAHPDDCELKAGGVGALWAAQGHKVKLVSVSNGDIGHWREAGGPLAKRRTEEV